MKKKIIILLAGIVVIILIAMLFIKKSKNPDVQLITYIAQEGEFELTVTASGNIQPVIKVDVGTQVSGIVKRIYADFNSQVKKGDLLAELDKSTLSERARQSRSSLNKAKSDSLFAKQNYDRIKALFDKNAATPASLEDATNRFSSAVNTVTNAKADLQQSIINLSYADIYSPISGRVLSRAVDEGQTVAASFNTPTLFTIANDLTKMQVEAKVDEADIGRIKIGQYADFIVDTYPGEKFGGTVSQIRLEPAVVQNVVTYTVIISAPNPDEKLFPGMTANISIITQSPKGICVPAEALYFTPDPANIGNYIVENENIKGNKVWIKTEKGFKAVPVTAGATDGITSIILSGVKSGDELVVGIEKTVTKKSSASILPTPPPGERHTAL
ncbi:MAG: hypothetical protein A2X18_01345 [Bacteroidetes bacterium GWF2_40_14]|nr:MAG: hypothetical protein A2X18_01345 [Bacteroidetes bacterium GWF2_40_14]